MSLFPVDCVQVLLEHGANANTQNTIMGSTPLHMATQSRKAGFENQLQVVDLLLGHGANVSIADRRGLVPIDNLTSQEGARPQELRDKLQPTDETLPIHVAIEEGDFGAVCRICKDGANDSATTSHPAPLRLALDNFLQAIIAQDDNKLDRLVTIINFLVPSGFRSVDAPVRDRESDDYDPLFECLSALFTLHRSKHLAQRPSAANSLSEIIVLLKDAGWPIFQHSKQLIHQAARYNLVGFARFLIHGIGIDPNTPGRQSMTPLQFAARSGQMDMINFLLCLDSIDVMAKDDRGQTALDAALVNDKQDAVAALQQFYQSNP